MENGRKFRDQREKGEHLKFIFETLTGEKKKYEKQQANKTLSEFEMIEYEAICTKLKVFFSKCGMFVKPRKNGVGKFMVDSYIQWTNENGDLFFEDVVSASELYANSKGTNQIDNRGIDSRFMQSDISQSPKGLVNFFLGDLSHRFSYYGGLQSEMPVHHQQTMTQFQFTRQDEQPTGTFSFRMPDPMHMQPISAKMDTHNVSYSADVRRSIQEPLGNFRQFIKPNHVIPKRNGSVQESAFYSPEFHQNTFMDGYMQQNLADPSRTYRDHPFNQLDQNLNANIPHAYYKKPDSLLSLDDINPLGAGDGMPLGHGQYTMPKASYGMLSPNIANTYPLSPQANKRPFPNQQAYQSTLNPEGEFADPRLDYAYYKSNPRSSNCPIAPGYNLQYRSNMMQQNHLDVNRGFPVGHPGIQQHYGYFHNHQRPQNATSIGNMGMFSRNINPATGPRHNQNEGPSVVKAGRRSASNNLCDDAAFQRLDTPTQKQTASANSTKSSVETKAAKKDKEIPEINYDQIPAKLDQESAHKSMPVKVKLNTKFASIFDHKKETTVSKGKSLKEFCISNGIGDKYKKVLEMPILIHADSVLHKTLMIACLNCVNKKSRKISAKDIEESFNMATKE